jgi:alkylation response protein AidB-like acyl-CoA dehydrogenase
LEETVNTFLSSEQETLLARYKAYVAEHIAPIAADLDEGKHSVRDVVTALGQEGFLGSIVAKEYGGHGAAFINYVLLAEAISEYEPGLALSLAAHAQVIEVLSRFGTDTQKSRYLPLLARGECIGAFALAEEAAGSDYSAIKTSAIVSGNKCVLTGEKSWVVNGSVANLALVVAKDGGSKLSLWLVDLDKKANIEIGSNRKKLGLRSAETNDISFKDLEISSDAMLGSQDSAEEAIRAALDVSKVVVAAAASGLLGSALHHSVDRARTREQFGANIGKLQAIQWKLADMSADSSAARLLTLRAGWSKDEAPEEFRRDAAMCKFYAAKTARVHSAEAVQIFGSLGVSDDEPIEKMYRDAKVMEIAEGTSEIQKNIVAKEVGV